MTFGTKGHAAQGLTPSAEALGDKCKEGGEKGWDQQSEKDQPSPWQKGWGKQLDRDHPDHGGFDATNARPGSDAHRLRAQKPSSLGWDDAVGWGDEVKLRDGTQVKVWNHPPVPEEEYESEQGEASRPECAARPGGRPGRSRSPKK